jgi:hypothetical protein
MIHLKSALGEGNYLDALLQDSGTQALDYAFNKPLTGGISTCSWCLLMISTNARTITW